MHLNIMLVHRVKKLKSLLKGSQRLLLKTLGVFVSLVFGLLLLDKFFPPQLEKLQNVSFVMNDREGQLLSVHLTKDDKWRLPVNVADVSEDFKNFLIITEDRRFLRHPGVDPIALIRATWQGLKQRRIVSGGSTLTMQTAKLLNPGPRTLTRKIKEIFRAFQLEWHFSKEEILKMYLTLTPYGKNLEGIRAGSLYYFGKEPLHLTPSEAALLVALPQNPTHLRPDRNPERARLQRNLVLKRVQPYLKKPHSPQDLQKAIEEPFALSQDNFPQHAYHLSHRLKNKGLNPYPTSLNSSFQKQVEDLLVKILDQQPIEQTAAALVIDNATREVLVYVGSGNPYNQQAQGYVDMITSIRSPGSALKPFIYGLAFEEGWLNPFSRLKDKPRKFGNYSPSNFLDRFHGTITVAEALQQSLNIPVITVLERLGPQQFMYWLQNYGLKLHLPPKSFEPSLAIGLGGVGIRLEELANLYATLANEGVYVPISYQCNTHRSTKKLLSPLSALSITHILRSAPPPPGYSPQTADMISPIAFKTGTSYGHRDAWCFGYSKKYTVGVWVGRADGSPVPAQMGRLHAAPILFQLFSLIEPHPTPWDLPGLPFSPSQNMKETQDFFISFPHDESVLLYDPSNPLNLSVRGGTPPYTWLVNQNPITIQTHDSKTLWNPISAGFHEIVVVDARGETARVTVQTTQTF